MYDHNAAAFMQIYLDQVVHCIHACLSLGCYMDLDQGCPVAILMPVVCFLLNLG